ncbi:MAG: class I SAM-dependent methyltransferase [Candidatus Hydrogenedentota bacterium]|nr:MAG: class I SAM-dependent methyltransferase [Candidatus Hydrogenedentota bacterium]
MPKTVDDVKKFWDSNPLWSGESQHEAGTKEFFEEHRRVKIDDVFAGELDERLFPKCSPSGRLLDLGCGPGFWLVEAASRDHKNIAAADLTENGLLLARRRCDLYGVKAFFSQQNAEELGFRDSTFSHVNCDGVIHHTPDTDACIREMARVLEDEGTAVISVYYRNIVLRAWPVLGWAGRLLSKMGAKLSGRGREKIFEVKDAEEMVRLYDGKDNPIGKCYTQKDFVKMLSPYFHVEETFLHYFPARSLPFGIPKALHKLLDRYLGFMIYAVMRKR